MAEAKRASALDRFLRLFADVKAGQSLTVTLLSANVFLVLTSYYIIKPVRDGLVIAAYSAEMKSYLVPLIVAVLALVVPAYGWLADRSPRRRLMNVSTWIFAAFLGLFGVAGQLGFEFPIVFFVFGSIFNVMVVAQVWSFANDIYTREEGGSLHPDGSGRGGAAGRTAADELCRYARAPPARGAPAGHEVDPHDCDNRRFQIA